MLECLGCGKPRLAESAGNRFHPACRVGDPPAAALALYLPLHS